MVKMLLPVLAGVAGFMLGKLGGKKDDGLVSEDNGMTAIFWVVVAVVLLAVVLGFVVMVKKA